MRARERVCAHAHTHIQEEAHTERDTDRHTHAGSASHLAMQFLLQHLCLLRLAAAPRAPTLTQVQPMCVCVCEITQIA